MRLLTLLVAADGDLRVSLHVHHDATLPVSLGVGRHLVACSTKKKNLGQSSNVHPVPTTGVSDDRQEFSPDEVGVLCGVSAGYAISLLPLFLLPLDGTVARRPESRHTVTKLSISCQLPGCQQQRALLMLHKQK